MAANIAITAIGMATSLGLDIKTSCAAARAGIARPVSLDYFPLKSPDDGSATAAAGHPIADLTSGFAGSGRLLRLAQLAADDLKEQLAMPRSDDRSQGLFLSLPSPMRRYTLLDRFTHRDTREAMQASTPDVEVLPLIEQLATRICQTIGHEAQATTSLAGRTGINQLLKQAIEQLRQGYIQRAIVGGIDSFLDYNTLMWLNNTGRLKTEENPVGFQPGEGAVFLVLEASHARTGNPTRAMATIEQVSFGQEFCAFSKQGQPTGAGTFRAIREIQADCLPTKSQTSWLLSDMNGEPYRAMDLSQALLKASHRWPSSFSSPNVWFPAMNFGDTGSAASAVAIAVAARALQSGNAPRQQATVLTASDATERSAVSLSTAD